MAFALSGMNPGMQPGARGKAPVLHSYYSTDTLATILASGYFDDVANIFASGYDDIFVRGSDGVALAKVTVTSGVVTLQPHNFVGGKLNAGTTDTATALAAHGIHIVSATQALTFSLADPYVGAEVTIEKTGGTTTIVSVIPSSTGVTFDGTNRKLAFDLAGESVTLKGISATRWVIAGNNGGVVATAT